MKKFVFVLSLIVCTGLMQAQSPVTIVPLKNILDDPKTNYIKEILGNRKDGIFILAGVQKSSGYVKKLNEDNSVVKLQPLPKEFTEAVLQHHVKLNDSYYFLHIEWGPHDLTAYEFDTKTGKVKLPARKIGSFNKDWKNFKEKFITSTNHSKLWVLQYDRKTASASPYKGNMEIICMVYDDKLKLLKTFTSDFGIENKLVEVMDFATDDDDLYCLYRKLDQDHSVIEVAKLNGTKPEIVASYNMKDTKANNQFNRATLNAKLNVAKGKVSINGYYANSPMGINGIFTGSVSGGRQGELIYHPFTESISSRYGEKCKYAGEHKKGYGPHSDNLRLQHVLFDPETEATYVIGQPVYDGFSGNGNYWHQRGSIYVAKINADGSLAYSTKIPYNRRNNQSVSYETILHKGLVYVFFSDSKDNTNSIEQTDKKPAELVVAVHGVDVVVTVDDSGELKKYPSGLPSGATDSQLFRKFDAGEMQFGIDDSYFVLKVN